MVRHGAVGRSVVDQMMSEVAGRRAGRIGPVGQSGSAARIESRGGVVHRRPIVHRRAVNRVDAAGGYLYGRHDDHRADHLYGRHRV
jgi:hypothetical protein